MAPVTWGYNNNNEDGVLIEERSDGSIVVWRKLHCYSQTDVDVDNVQIDAGVLMARFSK